ncbi:MULTISPECIES: type II secretion system major pseudopilin GspG [Undibacterium]|jgi:general secretion pathway protein G|nr:MULTISPECIES: type II secretion system major pseudopilin GspG [Undibacterium]
MGMQQKTKKQGGFTLLELLVVIVILGLLAAFVAPKYFGQIGKSKIQSAKAQIDAFDKGIDQYRLDTGHFPTTEQGLNALFAQPANEPLWRGPYLKKVIPLDPWNAAYVFRSPGTEGRDYEIVSYGADGKSGGSGEDADITNWGQ